MKILMAKVGLDGHDIGLKIASYVLRDEGFEVIYLGAYQTAEQVIAAAILEDVAVVGLSFLGGDHLVYAPRIVKLMKEKGVDVPLVVGGVMPPEDIATLKQMGVSQVFIEGTSHSTIAEYFKGLRREAASVRRS